MTDGAPAREHTAGRMIGANKRAVRDRMREQRAHLDDRTRREASLAARDLALAVDELRAARTVALYAAVRNEIDPAPLAEALRAADATLAYPRVVARDRHLAFHRVDDLSALRVGAFGIPEPDADSPPLPLDDIDAFIVPGLAFAPDGVRVGWGYGYYDVTLMGVPRALRLGYGYGFQVVDDLPADAHDARMDCVMTDRTVWQCPPRPR